MSFQKFGEDGADPEAHAEAQKVAELWSKEIWKELLDFSKIFFEFDFETESVSMKALALIPQKLRVIFEEWKINFEFETKNKIKISFFPKEISDGFVSFHQPKIGA